MQNTLTAFFVHSLFDKFECYRLDLIEQLLTMKSDHNYDVFISYKSEDINVASELCSFLTQNGLSVFFSQQSLNVRGDSDYSQIIDEALDKSSHMIVVASKVEYLSTGWVHYEWMTFANELRAGHKSGNLITLLSSDISLSLLPIGLRHRQAFTFDNYKAQILPYFGNVSDNVAIRRKTIDARWRWVFSLLTFILIGFVTWLLNSKYNTKEWPEVQDTYIVKYSDPGELEILAKEFSLDTTGVASRFMDALDGNSDAQYFIGNLCYEVNNTEDAIYWLSLSAGQENGFAANAIGRCYYNGHGVSKWPRNAFNWFRYSAEDLKCKDGMNNLALCYSQGFGTLFQNRRKAVKYYKSAALIGYVPAEYNLGICYCWGIGTRQDIPEGMRWLKQAASNGSQSAQRTLGNIYREGLLGVPVDTILANKYFMIALTGPDKQISQKVQDDMRYRARNVEQRTKSGEEYDDLWK